jgi:hypothetical protein
MYRAYRNTSRQVCLQQAVHFASSLNCQMPVLCRYKRLMCGTVYVGDSETFRTYFSPHS